MKCNNINVNVNGLELDVFPLFLGDGGLAAEAQESTTDTISFAGNGDGSEINDFRFICINNNNNTVVGNDEEPIPPIPPIPTAGQDLAVTKNDGTVSILLGNGDGTFVAADDVTVGSGPFSIAVGDFNADSNQDLAVANQNVGTVSILLGNGNGTFVAADDILLGGNGPVAVVVGDFN